MGLKLERCLLWLKMLSLIVVAFGAGSIMGATAVYLFIQSGFDADAMFSILIDSVSYIALGSSAFVFILVSEKVVEYVKLLKEADSDA